MSVQIRFVLVQIHFVLVFTATFQAVFFVLLARWERIQPSFMSQDAFSGFWRNPEILSIVKTAMYFSRFDFILRTTPPNREELALLRSTTLLL
jgi:hypothetical protein